MVIYLKKLNRLQEEQVEKEYTIQGMLLEFQILIILLVES